MSRCVYLPAIGDPLLTHLWIAQYKKNFKDVGGKLHVVLNSSYPTEILDYSFFLYRDLDTIGYLNIHSHMIGHGQALLEMFGKTTEENVMIIEDDCFVFDHDIVDKMFRGLETGAYDLAGSPRMSCSKELADKAAEVWGLDYSGLGDKGPAFWPNCLFVKQEDLGKTDLNFGTKGWQAGDMIKPLDRVAEGELAGDTLVDMSLQLRALGLRVREIPQHHGHVEDLLDYQNGEGIWGARVPWTHSGSSSSVQQDLYERRMPEAETVLQKKELERRFAWWLLAFELYEGELPAKIRKYMGDCRSHVADIIMRVGLSNQRINKLTEGYKKLL